MVFRDIADLTLRRAFRKVTPRRAGRHFWRLQENPRQGFKINTTVFAGFFAIFEYLSTLSVEKLTWSPSLATRPPESFNLRISWSLSCASLKTALNHTPWINVYLEYVFERFVSLLALFDLNRASVLSLRLVAHLASRQTSRSLKYDFCKY